MRMFAARLLLALGCLLCFAAITSAAITPEQRKEADAIKEEVSKAAKLYSEEKFKEAGDVVKAVQARIEKFSETADAQAIKLLDPVNSRLIKAHALLELEGVELPPLVKPEPGIKPMEKPMPGKPGEPKPDAATTSFVKEVAPILIAKCGNCHVREAKGKVSFSDFATLMKGPPEGTVIFPGDGPGSRLVEVIESGDMPRGGAKVSAMELATLKKWINEGAKFDGQDPKAELASLAPNTQAERPMVMVNVVQATGKETVSFARDVAPHLSDTCFNCHGAGRQLRAMFNLTTFNGLLKGGESGAVVIPGKGADSILVKKLKGMGDGQRMPLNLPALPDDVIAKIQKWIDEGAKYDGGDPAYNLKQVAALAKANSMSHEELAADRAVVAEQKWRLGLPGINAGVIESKNFLTMGNVPENELKMISEQAELVVPKVAALLKIPADKPAIKGKMTLYVFNQRYDYSEFGNMVEQRELPKSLKGHFFANPVEVYGAVIPAKQNEYGPDVLVAQQFAGAYAANLSKNPPPRWFSEGTGRATAARISPEDGRVIEWEMEIPRVLSSMASPDDFLTGKLSPEDADVCSFSFVRFLMSEGRKYDSLLAGLKKGQDFNQTFAAVYGGTPAQVAGPWAVKAAKARPPRGK